MHALECRCCTLPQQQRQLGCCPAARRPTPVHQHKLLVSVPGRQDTGNGSNIISSRRLSLLPAAAAARGAFHGRSSSNSNSSNSSNSNNGNTRLPPPGIPLGWATSSSQPQHQHQQQQQMHPADEFLQALRAPSELQHAKCFVFVRHGHSTWNEQSRIQGNTDLSELTDIGRMQAVRARAALQEMTFDSCFSSPHTRARQTAEIVWQPWLYGASVVEPQYLPSLSEVDLGWFQGLRNEDIARDHPELYRVWREEPERFELAGCSPVMDAFRQSRRAWQDMLAAPGCRHLVITHKSLLRALLCTALGLPPRQFRAIDIANGAICMVRSNARGDMRFTALNLTSHLLYDEVRYHQPAMDKNDQLAAGTTAPTQAAAAPAAAQAAQAATVCTAIGVQNGTSSVGPGGSLSSNGNGHGNGNCHGNNGGNSSSSSSSRQFLL